MQSSTSENESIRNEQKPQPTYLILLYPFALLFICLLLNTLIFGVSSLVVAIPTMESVRLVVVAAVLLIINHTWLMTTTELTRVKYRMFATPEEWRTSGTNRSNVTEEGVLELERHHNTHRNTTENSIYYVLLSFIFILGSPSSTAAIVWLMLFPLARLGYTYSYLNGKDGMRGAFMSLGLLSIYGMASYLMIALFV